jgi:hypothetical protein
MNEDKRTYQTRQYNSEQISQVLSIFMLESGSITQTQKRLNQEWGFSPTEPTIRKWIRTNDDAIKMLDQNSLRNLQDDISNIITLSQELLIKELEEGNFPAGKLGTLLGIMIDKWLILGRIRMDAERAAAQSNTPDTNLYLEPDQLMQALLKEPSIALNGKSS